MWGDTPHTPRFFIYLFFLSIYKAQRTQSCLFFLFSPERGENKKEHLTEYPFKLFAIRTISSRITGTLIS